jgi:hypothetical protein
MHQYLLNLKLALSESYNMYNYDKSDPIIKGSAR